MKIAVIGGSGFIGSHVVDRYLEDGHEVQIIDPRPPLPGQTADCRHHPIDAADPALRQLLESERFEIINFHAFSDLKLHGTRPEEDVRNNLTALLNVLEALPGLPLKKFIYASSGGIGYGEAAAPHRENQPFDLRSPLSALRVAAESYLQWYHERDGFPFTILRYANVYGPRQRFLGAHGLIPLMIRAMLRGERPRIHGDGEQTRDFVYVRDVARANLLALTSGADQIFNIASQEETSVNEIFRLLARLLDYTGDAEYGPARDGDEVRRNRVDAEKAARVLGFFPDFPLEDGLQESVDWFRAQPDFFSTAK